MDFYCSLFDLETNEFSNPVLLMINCMQIEYGTNIQYFSEKKEYIGHCLLGISTKNIIKFDENFEVKECENNSKYYISVSTKGGQCYNVFSMSLLYIKSRQDYFIARTCQINNVPSLDLVGITEDNIVKYEVPGDIKSESTSTLNIKTTILTPKTTLVSSTQIKSTTPTLKSTLISSIQKESTIPTLKSTLVSSIKKESTIPIIKSTYISSIQSTTTKAQPMSNIQTTTIKTQPLSLPLLSSEIHSSSFTSTKISNPISTHISNSIISKPSSIIITEHNIKTTYTKFTTFLLDKSTTLLPPNIPSSTIKNTLLSSKLSLPNSFISKSNIQNQNTLLTIYKSELIFHIEIYIMKAK